jgi:hypothetical protein
MSQRTKWAAPRAALCAVCVFACAGAAAATPALPGASWQAEALRFLATPRAFGGVGPGSAAFPFPRSYVDSAVFWAEDVCHWPARDCAVDDRYDLARHTLLPPPSPAGTLQAERIAVRHGSNLYDAALWQLALVLAARGDDAARDAAWLRATAVQRALRASEALRAPGGYTWRMIAPSWLLDDPLAAAPWQSLVTASGLPIPLGDYRAGRVTWNDWHPVTGENAWIWLIGPLQAAHLHHATGDAKAAGAAIPADDPMLQAAIASLPAFAREQAPNGAFWFSALPGTASGGSPRVERAVSIENNLSLYAGLQLLRATLRDSQPHSPALVEVDRLLDGTPAAAGVAARPGLEAFLRGQAWAGTHFHTTGWLDPATGAWRVADEPRAVDVQTWGIAALGPKRLDAWHGAGTALKLWQSFKAWGGYGEGTTLLGVGYSDLDGNGRDAQGRYRAGVLSSEWTAGAIDAVRALRAHYPANAELAGDEASMLEGFARLRIDRYDGAGFAGAAPRLAARVPVAGTPWLYASRRYAIPFGWVANPLPSTCATAWALLLEARYDPFGYRGVPN